ncbi:MAG: sialidase family protein [Bryobacteraceae bacterium]
MLPILALWLAVGGFETGAVVRSDGKEFERNAIPSIARLASGKLICVWTFAGKSITRLRLAGATSTDGGRSWSKPRVLMDHEGSNDADPVLLVDGKRLFVYSATVNIPDKLDRSRVFMISSDDEGQTWSAPRQIQLPKKYTATMVNNGLRLKDGTLLLPFGWDRWAEKGPPARTEGEMDLSSGVLRSTNGIDWTAHGDLHIWEPKMTPGSTNGLCEPAVVELASGELLMLMRTGTSHHYESRSRDRGLTWDAPKPSPLVGHNTPTALWRLDQKPSEFIAIWNNSPDKRYPLSIAISPDGGKTYSKPKNVADGNGLQVSYPGIVQATDGTFVAVWQEQLAGGGRDIRCARFTRDWVLQ